MRFWDGFDPDFDGIREIRISISTEQAEEMFDFEKIQNLISSDEITTRSDSVERLNQPYSDLQPAVKNEEALDEIIHTRLEQAGIDTEGISEKLRIRWGDRVGGRGSLEVYQTQTLDPLLPALIENLVRHSFDEPPQWYYPGEYSLC
ncbi:MAG: hypothetical protein ABEI52_03190, partial [Halobacteriaceae archaeon]